jgi:hypothetical protein
MEINVRARAAAFFHDVERLMFGVTKQQRLAAWMHASGSIAYCWRHGRASARSPSVLGDALYLAIASCHLTPERSPGEVLAAARRDFAVAQSLPAMDSIIAGLARNAGQITDRDPATILDGCREAVMHACAAAVRDEIEREILKQMTTEE